jgi:hypothetical protein
MNVKMLTMPSNKIVYTTSVLVPAATPKYVHTCKFGRGLSECATFVVRIGGNPAAIDKYLKNAS